MSSADSSSAAAASVDQRSGFCAATETFHSIRPPIALPPPSTPVSIPSFVFSLLPSPLPDHPAFVDASTGDSISYPHFIDQVTCLAANLQSQFGISKGDVIVVMSPNRMDLPVLYMSLLLIGAVASPANPALTPSEILQLIHLSKPSLAFATTSTSQRLPPDLNVVLLDTPQFKNLLKTTTPSNVENIERVEVQQSDLAMIQYSSGTTGRLKAAALPHRFFIVMASYFNRKRKAEGAQTKVVALTSSSIFRSMGFASVIIGLVQGGTSVILTGESISEANIMQAAKQYKVTHMTVGPTVVVAMAKSSQDLLTPPDFESLQLVVCSGAPLHVKSARQFREKFPHVQLLVGYGSTEGGSIAAMVGPEECSNLKSVGRLSCNVQAKIVDPDTGAAMSVGQAGELWIKSPFRMTGYIGDDEANAAAFDSEGWFKTGDLCYIDQDGFLYIVGRLKELIICNGYQVLPGELEDVLLSHPDVEDAAVFPISNDEVGQIPAALVVRRDGSTLCETEVMEYVAKQVAPYKRIQKVLMVDQIPKSPAGKISRQELSNFMFQGSLS